MYDDEPDLELPELEINEDPDLPIVEISGDKEGRFFIIHRHIIFRTTGIARGRICFLMITSKGTENSLPQEMVDKLDLKTDQLGKLYKIVWLGGEGGGEISITHHCLVKFLIGKVYRDAV